MYRLILRHYHDPPPDGDFRRSITNDTRDSMNNGFSLSRVLPECAPRPADSAVTTMATHYLALEPAPELLVFRVRLGLTVIDLAGGVEQPATAQATARLVGETVAAGDGYAARDVLAHDGCRAWLAKVEERALSAAVQSAGLGRGAIPASLMADLLEAVKLSETATARNLAMTISASPPSRRHS